MPLFLLVIPAQAGIHLDLARSNQGKMDPSFRWGDEKKSLSR